MITRVARPPAPQSAEHEPERAAILAAIALDPRVKPGDARCRRHETACHVALVLLLLAVALPLLGAGLARLLLSLRLL